MWEKKIQPDSLVVYKQHPARVISVGEKIEIEIDAGRTLNVRPKDILFLHPGPLLSLADLPTAEGEIRVAWDLLQDQTVTLEQLAELAFVEFTPATAWATYQLITDGLWFTGNPQQITARSPSDVELEMKTRQEKAEENQAWTNFINHLQTGQSLNFPLSGREKKYLQDIEDLAYGKRSDCPALRELGRAEKPENAHALLLELGYWDMFVDPYVIRAGLPTTSPQIKFPPLPIENRRDLTHLKSYAIDDINNQDPDDAISLDGDRIWVHIADLAAIIQPDTPLDIEARDRGANLYLPPGTIRMIPEELVHLLGLGLQPTSPALSFGLTLDEAGNLTAIEITPSWVNVERTTYDQVESCLDQEPFKTLLSITDRFLNRRRQNGALFIDLPEVMIHLENDQVIIRPVIRSLSRSIVREAMLMAGEAAALVAQRNNIPFPYVTQEATDISEPGDSLALMYAIRRSLNRSQVSSQPGLHAGIGLPAYARATSPLRRYLDLVAHQQLRAYLLGKPFLDEQALLERVGASEAVTNIVNRTEQLSRRHWTLVYLHQHLNWTGEGVLVEKRNMSGRLIIPEIALETQVHLRQEMALDTRLTLKARTINLPELDIYFQVL